MTADPSPVIRVAVARFPSIAAAVPDARASTVRTLREWSVDADTVDLAELVACELVSNAVKASRPDDVVALRLTVCDAVLTVEMWDASTVPPVLTVARPDQESGRGLVLVDAVSLRWAWYLPRAGGKVVWAQLPAAMTPAVPTDSTAALPSRSPAPVPAPAAPVTFHNDPATLQRVIDRLRGLDDWHRPSSGHGVKDRHHAGFRHRGGRPGGRAPMMMIRSAVPEYLRPVVLLARMRDLAPADQVAQMLGLFVPPIDPASRRWAALCDALDSYDRAERTGTGDLTTARHQVDAAASAVLGLAGPCPAQRTPGQDKEHP